MSSDNSSTIPPSLLLSRNIQDIKIKYIIGQKYWILEKFLNPANVETKTTIHIRNSTNNFDLALKFLSFIKNTPLI